MSDDEQFLRYYLVKWGTRFVTGEPVNILAVIRLKQHFLSRHGWKELQRVILEAELETAERLKGVDNETARQAYL